MVSGFTSARLSILYTVPGFSSCFDFRLLLGGVQSRCVRLQLTASSSAFPVQVPSSSVVTLNVNIVVVFESSPGIVTGTAYCYGVACAGYAL